MKTAVARKDTMFLKFFIENELDIIFQLFFNLVGQSVGQICPTTKAALTFSCKCLNFLGVPKGI